MWRGLPFLGMPPMVQFRASKTQNGDGEAPVWPALDLAIFILHGPKGSHGQVTGPSTFLEKLFNHVQPCFNQSSFGVIKVQCGTDPRPEVTLRLNPLAMASLRARWREDHTLPWLLTNKRSVQKGCTKSAK